MCMCVCVWGGGGGPAEKNEIERDFQICMIMYGTTLIDVANIWGDRNEQT